MKKNIVPPHVQEFCKKLFKHLEDDYWGDIDPYIFRTIGRGKVDDPDYLDEDASDSCRCFVKYLTKLLPKPKPSGKNA